MNICIPPLSTVATVAFMAALVSMFILGFICGGAFNVWLTKRR